MPRLERIIERYKTIPGGLLPALQAIQSEYGYVPRESIARVAAGFGLSPSKVFGVATFYSMLSVVPRGKTVIRLCASAACQLAGGRELLAAFEKELGIKLGETTPDGKISLETTECVGACNLTPVIMINEQPYGNITPEQVPELLQRFRPKEFSPETEFIPYGREV
ncbi:MAG: NADH-quinone oxidoreductase subunit NuoE [Firmicutes bacterium]|nr:NADH-quinone oxidoreductase subunit NuoE [Bacillota bacterium]